MEENPIDIIEYPKYWIYNARMLLIALSHFKMYDEFEIEQKKIKQFIDEVSEVKKTQNLNAQIYNTIYKHNFTFSLRIILKYI